MTQYFIQRFDYQINPIFNEHDNSLFSDSDNISIYESIQRIDNWVAIYIQEKPLVKRAEVDAAIARYVNDIRVVIHARSNAGTLLRQALDACLNEAHDYVHRFMNFSDSPSYQVKQNKEAPYDLAKYTQLKQQGFCEYQLPATEAFEIYRKQQLEEARNKYAGLEDWRGGNWEGYDQTEGYHILKNFILDQHILEMVSAYKGKEMEFKYIAWDYNHHRQQWFKNVNGVAKRSQTNYYHFDAEPNVAKMMIYLTDVQAGDGPFRFVKGSHALARSVFTIGLHYGVDAKLNPLVEAPPSLYRRNAFNYNRSLLMQLPHAFLGSTHFGDDLVEGSALSRYLLENTEVFTRKAGAGIVFDGYLGVHAGGNPIDGERLAVQIGFIQKKPVQLKTKKNVSIIERGKRYLKKKLNG